jgi:hypothetical protein
MHRFIATSLVLAVSFAASAPALSQFDHVPLAAHRAVYDLSLAQSSGTRSVASARGRIVFDFTGDPCEGYALNYRQVTVLESGETGPRTSDLRTTTFEAGDGTSLRFKSESQMDGAVKSAIDGEAEVGRGHLAIRLTRPKRETITVAGAPLFPSEHMKRLITAGRNGERTVAVSVFDGSDDGKKVYDTLAVIGRRIEPGNTGALETAARQESLARLSRWPVTLSYFAPGDGERTPMYVISFEMYENGVSRALRLDYGEFALKGDMQSVDFLPASACRR